MCLKEKELLNNVEKIHTTEMGKKRIEKNLNLYNCDVVNYCKNIVKSETTIIYKKGKNYYCEIDDIIITINSFSYTIITAHKKNKKKEVIK